METYVLLIFLAYTVPADKDTGIGGGAALASEKHVFWSKKDCMEAAALLTGALERKFSRSAIVCVRSSSPSGTEEPKLGMKGG